MRKVYENLKTNEETTNATIALQWHRRGDNITVWDFSNGTTNYVDINGAAQQKKNDENRNHCKAISENLDLYVEGLVYKCPDCGKEIVVPDTWSGECYKCPDCGTVSTERELEPLTLWDYFEGGIYDIEYRIGSDKEYRSVKVMVACGGPNIYIDTKSGDVELYWWTESARYPLSNNAIEELDNYFEELFNC